MKFYFLILSFALAMNAQAKPVVAKASAERKPASRSSWLVCKPQKPFNSHDSFTPVVMLFSHLDGVDTWKTEVYMNYGVYLMTGSFVQDDSSSGKVAMRWVQNPMKSLFDGVVAVDYQANKVTIIGTTTVSGNTEKYNATIPCESM